MRAILFVYFFRIRCLVVAITFLPILSVLEVGFAYLGRVGFVVRFWGSGVPSSTLICCEGLLGRVRL